MNILKKFCLIGLCAFSVIFCEAIIPMQPAYAYQENISRGYELIEETWQGRDGSIMSITDRDFGEVPYSVRSVSNDGNYTVVTISVNGGRSINTLTFDNNNPNYMMLKMNMSLYLLTITILNVVKILLALVNTMMFFLILFLKNYMKTGLQNRFLMHF